MHSASWFIPAGNFYCPCSLVLKSLDNQFGIALMACEWHDRRSYFFRIWYWNVFFSLILKRRLLPYEHLGWLQPFGVLLSLLSVFLNSRATFLPPDSEFGMCFAWWQSTVAEGTKSPELTSSEYMRCNTKRELSCHYHCASPVFLLDFVVLPLFHLPALRYRVVLWGKGLLISVISVFSKPIPAWAILHYVFNCVFILSLLP